MKIYRVRPDSNNIQLVFPEESALLTDGTLDFDCQPKVSWQPLDFYIYNPKAQSKDFYSLGSSSSVLVFNQKVLNEMLDLFEMAGEILSIKIEQENLYVLNVLECINSLNKKLTTHDLYEDGSPGRILKYSFHSNRLSESSIFKIPETSSTEVLTYSRGDEQTEFYSRYKKSGLTGLIFEEVYNTN